ncbi:MAG TPA: chemotaxis protein CheB [Pirellulales bacterium]|nr:chemotaxis protein CheB [Pirellulales bacterium]
MSGINLVVIGGSAGALPALEELVRDLPSEFPAALCVVLHTSAGSPGLLPEIVGRRTRLACTYARDGDAMKPGTVYFASADRHLLIEDGRLRVTHGPRENGFRPAVDPLFRTAARARDRRVAGIILSGSLGDGSAGLALIKQAGGTSIVQDPNEALFSSMPQAAIAGVDIDYVVRAAEIGPLLLTLTNGGLARGAAMSDKSSTKTDTADRGGDLSKEAPQGELTPFTCPECGGSLWEQDNGRQIRFRCHVGHAYNGESLLQYVTEEVESALWTALRVLEEHALLQERMAARSEAFELAASAAHFHSRAADSRRQAETLRNVLMNESHSPPTESKQE